jgi:hypothetical protein
MSKGEAPQKYQHWRLESDRRPDAHRAHRLVGCDNGGKTETEQDGG